MRLPTVCISTVFMVASLASPISGSSGQKATDILDTVKALRENVRVETDNIRVSLSQMSAQSTEAQNSTSAADVRVAFSHVIVLVEGAALKIAAKSSIETRQTIGSPISEIAGEITAILQDIVSDAIGAINLALNAFGDSRLIQDLAGSLTHGLLDFLNSILQVVVKVPGIPDLISYILKLIPI